MGGRHDDHDEKMTPTALRFALWVLIPCAVAAIIGLVVLWPGDTTVEGQPSTAVEVTGTIVAIEEQPCPELPDGYEPPPGSPAPDRCGIAEVELDDGATVTTSLPTGSGAPVVDTGDAVVLMHLPDSMAGEYSYHIVDHDRSTQLWVLFVAFAAAVIAFGRLRGVTALIGLAVTFAILLLFIVPAILDGRQPLLVAIVGSAAIMLAVLYLTHGFSTSTTIAVLGVLASLVLTGVLSALAVNLAHLTGIADEDTTYLSMNLGVNMQGLLLAGILIGSLGVLDDVSVTQAATVTELARANPRYTPRQLYTSSIRVGRSHIASVVNTIILAYAGASLPLLILIAAVDRPIGQILTNQIIAEEIVRSVVGTIGLIAAVPITTALAAVTVRRFAPMAAGPHDPEHGTGGVVLPVEPVDPDPDDTTAALPSDPAEESTPDSRRSADSDWATDHPQQTPGERPRPDRNDWLGMYDEGR
ncbi:YibE/F family protein [Stackebrandtia soli]|uniref:YibE/F family protein n=1 Tax=Stackebrandtia soli TaxID=1892856 RepID=UPI0039E945B2